MAPILLNFNNNKYIQKTYYQYVGYTLRHRKSGLGDRLCISEQKNADQTAKYNRHQQV
jgi:hypothetical protein